MNKQILTQTNAILTQSSPPVNSGMLQRACACGQHSQAGGECEGCKKKRVGLQRSPLSLQGSMRNIAGGEGYYAPPIVHQALRSPGEPLDGDTRQLMEARFGHDFSGVRVHSDGLAAESAVVLDARAYTVGRDVVFGAAQYNPRTIDGQSLIAHELVHVAQQSGLGAAIPEKLEVGAPDDLYERQARRAAVQSMEYSRPTNVPVAQRSLVQRQLVGLPGVPGLGSVNLPIESVELESGETISEKNPKLQRVAQAFKSLQSANPSANIELSADLTSAAKMSSSRETSERSRLGERLTAARQVLQSLGVPRDRIDIRPPTAYATSARGQVKVDVIKERPAAPFLLPPSPQPVPGTPAPSQPQPSTPGLSDLLTLKFGPLTIELPKSAALKLPIPITAAKKLVVDLKAEASGTFSFSITLDGLRYVRVSLKAGASYEKEKGATGTAGLQIELTRTVCRADNPEGLKAKISKAGEDLKKAMQEYSAESDTDKKLMKLADIGGALGEMYDAVDKAKSGCKQVPAAKFEFGVKGPLGGEEDPSKREPGYIGGTITIPF